MTIDQLNKLTDEEVRVRVALALGMCAHPIEAWQREGTEGDMELVCNKCGKSLRDARIPNYPSDLNAAFTLVEKLRGEGWEFALTRRGCLWEAELVLNDYNDEVGVDTNPARAICLCFLAVTEREEG